jgi:hypothetical protein
VDALAALRREQRDDVVARGHARDALADLLDDARPLVPENGRRVAGRVRAAGGVEVGVAHPAGGETDQHLARPGPVEVHLLHRQRLGELLEDGGAHLHGGGG